MHRHCAWMLVVAATAWPAHAQTGGSVTEIWKCRGADGRWTYTNDRREAERQKCEVVTRQINVAPTPARSAPAAPAARPGNFPRESAAERERRSANSREILEKELATEQAALAKAREELTAQESVRYGNERNYGRVIERLQPYKDSVETHEKNIEALKRELGNVH